MPPPVEPVSIEAQLEIPRAPAGGPTAPRGVVRVRQRGAELIGSPLLNKSTAFTAQEREAFGLRGLLPPHVATIEEQVDLEVEHVRRKSDDLEQYIGLAALQDRNETLFYRLLVSNLAEFMPIVYTPTVGRACKEFSHIFRRPRGVWITPADVGRMEEILAGAAPHGIRLLVVTDNERILGLGDQGAGGMSIPVGKLALYTAGAGIYPSQTLPVSLDVGTDNPALLEDPLYLGYRAPRLRGQAYDDVLEAFVEAVGRVFPGAVVQWEDFKQHNALRVLERYRHRLPSFNDDVQGTGGVTLGGLLAARSARGGLAGERILFLGAGAAALGIGRMVKLQLASEGLPATEIRDSMAHMDSKGLIHDGREIADDQRPFSMSTERFAARGLDDASARDPVAVARAVRPTILIGTTGTPGTFSEELVREVARHDPEPIVLPLTNPGDKCEARPEQILTWTEGRALVASGSPFPPVELAGDGTRIIAQANNVFVFPGVGLAAIVAGAREITDEAFIVAARELASRVTPERLAEGGLYPPIEDLRAVSRAIAIAVVRHFRDTGYGRHLHDDDIEAAVDRAIWWPDYLPYEPV
ncbi:MAG: NAD-dependent malic enzyme [Chloroflexi bacterium]|nr:NAD-dependent malic enzyme [Chloroflexota bacterium]